MGQGQSLADCSTARLYLYKQMLKVPPGGVPSLQSFLRTQGYQLLSKKTLLNVHTKFILGFADSIQQGKRQQCSCEHGALATGAQPGRLWVALSLPEATEHLLP